MRPLHRYPVLPNLSEGCLLLPGYWMDSGYGRYSSKICGCAPLRTLVGIAVLLNSGVSSKRARQYFGQVHRLASGSLPYLLPAGEASRHHIPLRRSGADSRQQHALTELLRS